MTVEVVEIEATNRCNARCLHCPRDAITRPLGTMSWDTFVVVAHKVMQHRDVRAISFSGMGEPTLNPNLARFIAYLPRQVFTLVTTNASLLSPKIIREWIEAGLDEVTVSFNGHNAGLYSLMTGGLALDLVEKRLRELVRLTRGQIRLSANVSVTRQTRPHLSEIRERLVDLGICDVQFSMCHNRGGYLDDPMVCDTPLPPVGEGRCDIFASTLFISWDGRVLACCHDLQGKGELGDLVVEALEDILDRRERVLREGVSFSMCEHCNDMYRFARDPTPDGRPLSEWIYLLSSSDTKDDALVEIIRRQESYIDELRQVIRGYESGRFIRFARWVHKVRQAVIARLGL